LAAPIRTIYSLEFRSTRLDEEDKGGYDSKIDVIGCEKNMRGRDGVTGEQPEQWVSRG
jgi:hypothetical protein